MDASSEFAEMTVQFLTSVFNEHYIHSYQLKTMSEHIYGFKKTQEEGDVWVFSPKEGIFEPCFDTVLEEGLVHDFLRVVTLPAPDQPKDSSNDGTRILRKKPLETGVLPPEILGKDGVLRRKWRDLGVEKEGTPLESLIAATKSKIKLDQPVRAMKARIWAGKVCLRPGFDSLTPGRRLALLLTMYRSFLYLRDQEVNDAFGKSYHAVRAELELLKTIFSDNPFFRAQYGAYDFPAAWHAYLKTHINTTSRLVLQYTLNKIDRLHSEYSAEILTPHVQSNQLLQSLRQVCLDCMAMLVHHPKDLLTFPTNWLDFPTWSAYNSSPTRYRESIFQADYVLSLPEASTYRSEWALRLRSSTAFSLALRSLRASSAWSLPPFHQKHTDSPAEELFRMLESHPAMASTTETWGFFIVRPPGITDARWNQSQTHLERIIRASITSPSSTLTPEQETRQTNWLSRFELLTIEIKLDSDDPKQKNGITSPSALQFYQHFLPSLPPTAYPGFLRPLCLLLNPSCINLLLTRPDEPALQQLPDRFGLNAGKWAWPDAEKGPFGRVGHVHVLDAMFQGEDAGRRGWWRVKSGSLVELWRGMWGEMPVWRDAGVVEGMGKERTWCWGPT
ncbi:hypothetical protein BJ508DRAFT_362670 [Ascobolus immersus RN42]|uniref:Uncharacterized protein n=1 Tax=Ascobolus immersus RN42 TaxID=1160509 RepID=A0A3N4I2G7_ASCIM|nr:hypothetical protein BJ508DRAFT_362670 [Ascobolus immersus RN42]